MFLKNNRIHVLVVTAFLFSVLFFSGLQGMGTPHFMDIRSINDTLKPGELPFPIHDRYGDFMSNPSGNTYDLKNPSNIKDSVVYDIKTQRYTIYEKIGNNYFCFVSF